LGSADSLPFCVQAMERAAVTLAKEVGYVNAGTVEYLFTTEEPHEFFFLELNPRLQVRGEWSLVHRILS
jgi:acetyl-CoA carboxylase / biotin carboxylase 1